MSASEQIPLSPHSSKRVGLKPKLIVSAPQGVLIRISNNGVEHIAIRRTLGHFFTILYPNYVQSSLNCNGSSPVQTLGAP
jgi:hypothetical protein